MNRIDPPRAAQTSAPAAYSAGGGCGKGARVEDSTHPRLEAMEHEAIAHMPARFTQTIAAAAALASSCTISAAGLMELISDTLLPACQ